MQGTLIHLIVRFTFKKKKIPFLGRGTLKSCEFAISSKKFLSCVGVAL